MTPGQTALGQLIRAPLVEIDLLHVELRQWIALLALVLAAWLLSRPAGRLAARLLDSFTRHTRTALHDRVLEALAGPFRLLAALGMVAAGILALGLAPPARDFFFALGKGLSLVAVGWLGFRLVDVAGDSIHHHLIARRQAAATAIVPLGRRTAKLALAALVFLAVLDDLGVHVAALLAGLGVGGLAVALAAKRTVESFFGAVSVVEDRPVNVGDFCRFGDWMGTVGNIGLRSTQIRTLDRTVVTVPNSSFAQLELENDSRRHRIWYQPTIGLRYETAPDQLCLPRFPEKEIERLRGALAWPPSGAAMWGNASDRTV